MQVFIGSSELVQLLTGSDLIDIPSLVGTIIRWEDLQDAGATATQKESEPVIEAPTAIVLTFSIPRGAFPWLASQIQARETAVRWFRNIRFTDWAELRSQALLS